MFFSFFKCFGWRPPPFIYCGQPIFVQPLVLSVSDLGWPSVGFQSHGIVDHLCMLRVYVSLTVHSIGEQALAGFELTTFRSRVERANHLATNSPLCCVLFAVTFNLLHPFYSYSFWGPQILRQRTPSLAYMFLASNPTAFCLGDLCHYLTCRLNGGVTVWCWSAHWSYKKRCS